MGEAVGGISQFLSRICVESRDVGGGTSGRAMEEGGANIVDRVEDSPPSNSPTKEGARGGDMMPAPGGDMTGDRGAVDVKLDGPGS